MSLIGLVFLIAGVGLALYFVNTVFPMPQWLRTTANVIAAVFVLVYVLKLAGFSGPHLYLK